MMKLINYLRETLDFKKSFLVAKFSLNHQMNISKVTHLKKVYIIYYDYALLLA